MQLNWNDIRPLNGSQANGFEELCAQLVRAESPDEAKFVRKGTPDAGVECYCILSDGNEWGWQAKYFDILGTTQWSQLDKSVKTALDKHPAEIYHMFLGEYGWSPAFRYFNQLYYGCSGWTTPERNCPTPVRPVLFKYNVETQGFDCSVDESYILRLPDHDIIERLGLKWTRQGANFSANRIG